MGANRNGLWGLFAIAMLVAGAGTIVTHADAQAGKQPAPPKGQPAAPPKGAPQPKASADPLAPKAPPPSTAQPPGAKAPPAQPPGAKAPPAPPSKPAPPGKGAPPPAPDPKEDAKKAWEEGQTKFEAGDYAGALEAYQRADQLYPGAAPKQKIALSLDKLGKAREAIAAYKAFIDSNPGEKFAEKIADANKRIGELQATLPAVVNLTITPADAKNVAVTVDGNAAQGTRLEVSAGEHTVVVTADGMEPATQVVTVKGDETKELAVTLKPVVKAAPKPVPPPEEEEEGGGSNVPAYVTLGIAGAGVVLGVVFGVLALQSKNDFDDKVDVPGTDPTELTDLADSAERSALIADMSFGVALTFGITGIVLLFSNAGDEDEAADSAEEALHVTPYAGPNGAGASVELTF
jgi:tetratricopeptide (TPR) repeat protein